MSFNLYFARKHPKKWEEALVDFPFQTPTDLTMSVMQADTNKQRLQMIKTYLKSVKCEQYNMTKILQKIKWMMEDDDLELTYI